MYLEKISYFMNDRSEVSNQALAKVLATENNSEGIEEIALNLDNKNKSIASDCLKVLYEASYINPELIVPYKDKFISLLNSKNNRMVWGGMIAIASIAKVRPEEIYEIVDVILEKIETGSVITNVHGVYAMINMARSDVLYPKLKMHLFELQRVCRPIDFPKRAETMIDVIKEEDRDGYLLLLKNGMTELSSAGEKRLLKLLKKYEGR